MEKEILKVIAIIASDSLYKQVYASELKMLFRMLEREQKTYLQNGANTMVGAPILNNQL